MKEQHSGHETKRLDPFMEGLKAMAWSTIQWTAIWAVIDTALVGAINAFSKTTKIYNGPSRILEGIGSSAIIMGIFSIFDGMRAANHAKDVNRHIEQLEKHQAVTEAVMGVQGGCAQGTCGHATCGKSSPVLTHADRVAAEKAIAAEKQAAVS